MSKRESWLRCSAPEPHNLTNTSIHPWDQKDFPSRRLHLREANTSQYHQKVHGILKTVLHDLDATIFPTEFLVWESRAFLPQSVMDVRYRGLLENLWVEAVKVSHPVEKLGPPPVLQIYLRQVQFLAGSVPSFWDLQGFLYAFGCPCPWCNLNEDGQGIEMLHLCLLPSSSHQEDDPSPGFEMHLPDFQA